MALISILTWHWMMLMAIMKLLSKDFNWIQKIFQTGTYFDSNTNKICKVEFMINENMISYLLASYDGINSIMLEDYLFQSCLHEIGHMVDALKTFDGSKSKR